MADNCLSLQGHGKKSAGIGDVDWAVFLPFSGRSIGSSQNHKISYNSVELTPSHNTSITENAILGQQKCSIFYINWYISNIVFMILQILNILNLFTIF